MCGRYTVGKASTKEFEKALDMEMPEIGPRYNVCPGQDNPVIRGEESVALSVVCESMRWGFVPNWLKEPATQAATINARVDTAAEKPYFRDAYRKRRCLVPADGYYEWQQVGKAKIPHYLQWGEGAFAFAGLWDSWEGAAPFTSYAIITTAAAEAIQFIHHRMPVVLPERHWKAWLDDATPVDALPAILEDAAIDFHTHAVSSLVNSRDNEGPELVNPVKRSLQGEFDFT
ncbi:MAG: SOS response-associated peptidase [Opitutales bacterium]